MGAFQKLRSRVGPQSKSDRVDHVENCEERLHEWVDTPSRQRQAVNELQNNMDGLKELFGAELESDEYAEVEEKRKEFVEKLEDIKERAEFTDEDVSVLHDIIDYTYGTAVDMVRDEDREENKGGHRDAVGGSEW